MDTKIDQTEELPIKHKESLTPRLLRREIGMGSPMCVPVALGKKENR
jgi:hypothetical protein